MMDGYWSLDPHPLQSPVPRASFASREGVAGSGANPDSYWTRPDELAQVRRLRPARPHSQVQVRTEPGRLPGLVRSPGRFTIWCGTSSWLSTCSAAGYKQQRQLPFLAVVAWCRPDRTYSAANHRPGRASSIISYSVYLEEELVGS